MVKITENVQDALASLKEAIDDFWAVLEADSTLDKDGKAEVTLLVEGAGDNIDEAREFVRDNAELE